MNINKRTQDISQVFDSQWNVNHNYSEVKKFHASRREHFNKMFNIEDKDKRKEAILRASSVNGKIENLNQKMSAMNDNINFAIKK